MKKETIKFLIFSAIVIIIFSSIVYGLYNNKDRQEEKSSEENIKITDCELPVKVSYINLTEKEIEEVKEILCDTSLIYLKRQKEIVFADNVTEYCSKYKNGERYECVGINYGKGRIIYIRYNDDEDSLRATFCHELLHTSVVDKEKNQDYEEELVDDLAQKFVCYKDGWWLYK